MQRLKNDYMQRAAEAYKIVLINEERAQEEILEILKEQNFIAIDKNLLASAPSVADYKKFSYGSISLLSLKNSYAIRVETAKFDIYLKDALQKESFVKELIALFSLLFALLSALFYWLKKNLFPLKKLHEEIKKFGSGSLDISTVSEGKDEIAVVSNEFAKAASKIKKLQNARELFLRNIMHEFKTPITKGRFCVDMMEENHYSSLLSEVFMRLDALVQELAEIESLSSSNRSLKLGEYRIVDILDNACDMLFCDTDSVEMNLGTQTVKADFRLFSLVCKNLIDNAVKYSDDKKVEVFYDDEKLFFCSRGERLKYPLDEYLEPFFKEDTHSDDGEKGFGLGLYIVNEICKLHGFRLGYEYADGKNCFYVCFEV
jgi:two-component system OmpR family sensor kinase